MDFHFYSEFDLMETVFQKDKVNDFYRRHNEKRSGEAAGGKFDGKAIKNLWSEKALEDLKENFPPAHLFKKKSTK